MKLITKVVAVVSIVMLTGGCLPLVAAVVGSTGTVIAARVKYKGDLEKTKAIEEFRDRVTTELGKINERLEEAETNAIVEEEVVQ